MKQGMNPATQSRLQHEVGEGGLGGSTFVVVAIGQLDLLGDKLLEADGLAILAALGNLGLLGDELLGADGLAILVALDRLGLLGDKVLDGRLVLLVALRQVGLLGDEVLYETSSSW